MINITVNIIRQIKSFVLKVYLVKRCIFDGFNKKKNNNNHNQKLLINSNLPVCAKNGENVNDIGSGIMI